MHVRAASYAGLSAIRVYEFVLGFAIAAVGVWLVASLLDTRAPATDEATIRLEKHVDRFLPALEAIRAHAAGEPGWVDDIVPSSRLSAMHVLRIEPKGTAAAAVAIEIQRAHLPLTEAWLLASPTTGETATDETATDETAGRTAPARRLFLQKSSSGVVAILPEPLTEARHVVVGAANLGTLKPRFRLRDAVNFHAEERYYHYLNGVTLGVFLLLAAFGSLIALVARDSMFLYFAGWSMTSLRTVAVNEGWATNWLFETFPAPYVPELMGVTLALHVLFSLLLFGAIFRSHFPDRLHRIWIGALAVACVVAIALAVSPAAAVFYPTIWTIAALGMAGTAVSLAHAWLNVRSKVLLWYSCFWLVTLSGLAGEIAYAAGLLPRNLPMLNAQGGAMLGALVMAVTLAQHFIDIRAERRRAQLAEVDALRRLANTYGSMPIGLFRMEQAGTITLFNPAFAAVFGITEDGIGRAKPDAPALFGAAAYQALLQAAEDPDTRSTCVEVRCGSGEPRHLQFTARRSGGGIEGSVQDVTARVRAETALARLVDHDVQTVALNQRGLDNAVRRAIELSRNGTSCAMITVDIDRFKTFNELYGLLLGDKLLAEACARIIDAVRPSDSVARIGDSFKIVLADVDADAATAVAKAAHAAISGRPFEIAGRLLSVTASVGLVPVDPSMDVREAMAASAQACAEAKTKGRDRVVHLGKRDMALRGYLEELKVQENLQDRIDSQRFFLEFQPIVSLKSAFELLNYEVLVRMRREDGSIIAPGRFIPAAERNGQMSLIDRWVVLSTLRWLDRHRDHLRRLGYATINLSGSSLNDARFVDNLFAMIADFPTVMSKLCFEITESVALADQNATRRFCERVHSMGSRVALDDFGAGYTSFTYLREIDADVIKIDGSFVKDINRNPANHAITRMIADLSHQLGKRCVAEWAEKPDVIATLMQIGVDYGQGYALSRPLPPSALVHVESCGELIVDPAVRALLQGDLSAEQVASARQPDALQAALF